ncbi:MAG: EAL domain-containing response regulator [Rhodospirillaceae bacterium]
MSAIAGPARTSCHVLVVDDHPYVRSSLKNTLLMLGAHSVAEAVDGDDALAHLRQSRTPFDLIICDLQMPGRDGIETLRELAASGSRACIVLMSGEDAGILTASANLAKSHGLRIIGYVIKPVLAEHLKQFLVTAMMPEAAQQASRPAQPIDDADIRRGLAADEFFAVFQPKVTIASRALEGVEALIRWRHPRFGLVNPLAFITVAETTDTIDLLTDLVLSRALEAQALWKCEGQDIDIAVNISTKSMMRLDLPDRLAATVARFGGRPTRVLLEVTESRVVDDLPTFLDIATRLRLKGFRLAIDDFGTGFSTLEQLSRLPVSELKIDRAFVAGTPDNPRTRAILEASLVLARSLNLTTVCEGAETAAEWDLAGRLGADGVQGYFVAKPMEAGDLAAWYRSWR